jgi:hypothetical protein
MTSDQVNIGQMNSSNFINGDVFGDVISTSYETVQKQSLAEATAEIQRLLKQLEETNPTATENEQVTYLNIATKIDIKKRIISALKEAGETAIDEFVLENKYLRVVKAATKGWLQASS